MALGERSTLSTTSNWMAWPRRRRSRWAAVARTVSAGDLSRWRPTRHRAGRAGNTMPGEFGRPRSRATGDAVRSRCRPSRRPLRRTADSRGETPIVSADDLDDAASRRIASMGLVGDSPQLSARAQESKPDACHSGAVLVLAGIGGPDAVRQLLGALPAGFPRPVLVQQRLDGGRYDRLVAQMQRATHAAGEAGRAGHACIGRRQSTSCRRSRRVVQRRRHRLQRRARPSVLVLAADRGLGRAAAQRRRPGAGRCRDEPILGRRAGRRSGAGRLLRRGRDRRR